MRPEGPGPLNSKICSMSIPFTLVIYFKSILLHKNWQGGGKLLLKNVIDSYAYKPCFCPRPDLH